MQRARPWLECQALHCPLPAAHGRLGTLTLTGQTGLHQQPAISDRSVVWQMASTGSSTSTPYHVVWLAVVIMATGEGVWPLLVWPGHQVLHVGAGPDPELLGLLLSSSLFPSALRCDWHLMKLPPCAGWSMAFRDPVSRWMGRARRRTVR